MPLIVSDTSPIRALAHLGRLEILYRLFGAILVPPAVDAELKNAPTGLPMVDVATIEFINVQVPRDRAKVEELLQTLDPGESEALTLALELEVPAILMDEAAGRKVAVRLGLLPIGVLGTLVRAKQRGLFERVEPFIVRLESEIDFFISPILRVTIMRMAGEG